MTIRMACYVGADRRQNYNSQASVFKGYTQRCSISRSCQLLVSKNLNSWFRSRLSCVFFSGLLAVVEGETCRSSLNMQSVHWFTVASRRTVFAYYRAQNLGSSSHWNRWQRCGLYCRRQCLIFSHIACLGSSILTFGNVGIFVFVRSTF